MNATSSLAILNPHFCHRFSSIRYYSDESKLEVAVKALKDEVVKKQEGVSPAAPKPEIILPETQKKSLGQRILEEVKHYYHGFRLLTKNVKISVLLAWQLLQGKTLSRREQKLLTRTVSDMFRLIPFSVFVIVPFMEFTLPFFLWLFPGMMPSTFQTTDAKEQKTKKELRLKLEMAKFLQGTLDEMSLASSGGHSSDAAREFITFFEKVRSSGRQVTNEEILKFSKFFEDELTLDNLSRQQLVALCRLLELQTMGTNNFLNFQLRMRLRSLKADDKVIKKEGVENLTVWELQQVCKARGMRSVGVAEDRLRSQLNQWLELSLTENIPPSLLLLTRALYLPEHVSAAEQIAKTIQQLPESVAVETKAKLGEREGKVDNEIRLQLIREEEKKIKAEKKEQKLAQEAADQQKKVLEEKKQLEEEAIRKTLVSKEMIVDKAPLFQDSNIQASEEKLSTQDLDEIESAIETISAEKKQLLLEKEELAELKEEMEDYKEDIEELKDVIAQAGIPEKELHESKAANRLFKKVNKMIIKVDKTIDNLEKRKEEMQAVAPSAVDDDIISIEELVTAIRRLKKTPDEARLRNIERVLEEVDYDRDGKVKVDDVLKVVELMDLEQQSISTNQLKEIVQMLEKEENLEMVEKIEKVMDHKSGDNSPKVAQPVGKAALHPPSPPPPM